MGKHMTMLRFRANAGRAVKAPPLNEVRTLNDYWESKHVEEGKCKRTTCQSFGGIVYVNDVARRSRNWLSVRRSD